MTIKMSNFFYLTFKRKLKYMRVGVKLKDIWKFDNLVEKKVVVRNDTYHYIFANDATIIIYPLNKRKFA